MRIIGGFHKGRSINAAKKGTRPTKGMVREAVFNILGGRVVNAQVLDVFAGSGAMGIEALSRGAAFCCFIENRPRALSHNVKEISCVAKVKIIGADFRPGLKKLRGKKFDVIFIDPPYGRGYVPDVLNLIQAADLLSDGGVIVAEHSNRDLVEPPGGFTAMKSRRYGDTMITVFRSVRYERGER